jgi:hypothetical protein
MVGEISPDTLLDVFHDCMAPCESVIASDGNYFELIIKWSYWFCIIPRSGKDTTPGAGHLVLHENPVLEVAMGASPGGEVCVANPVIGMVIHISEVNMNAFQFTHDFKESCLFKKFGFLRRNPTELPPVSILIFALHSAAGQDHVSQHRIVLCRPWTT